MSNGDANPFPTGTLYDLVLFCAAGSPQPWWANIGEWNAACWIKDEVQKRYAPQVGCPAKEPPSATAVASDVAGSVAPLVMSTVPGSVVETAALQYAQNLFPMAQVGYQLQLALCAGQPGTQPAPVPLPVPGPGPTAPSPGPGGQPQPQLPPTPPPSPARAALWLGAIALAGAFFWSRRKKR